MDNTKRIKKIRSGEVTSDKMDKTIVVKVQRQMPHPKYERIIKRYTKFKVHDEKKQAKVGDMVKIIETRPLSKDKRWRLLEVLTKR